MQVYATDARVAKRAAAAPDRPSDQPRKQKGHQESCQHPGDQSAVAIQQRDEMQTGS
jgi:hypothetical protein